MRFLTALLCAVFALSLSPRPANAEVEHQGFVSLIQASPGVHLTLSGGKLGVGANLDVLAGTVWGSRDLFAIGPGIVAGPFAEVNAVWKEGVSYTVGWRAGAGALAPTLFGGFMTFGMVAVDQGRTRGAVEGERIGLHVRSVLGGVGVNLVEAPLRAANIGNYDDAPPQGQSFVFTGGLELPMLPLPAVE